MKKMKKFREKYKIEKIKKKIEKKYFVDIFLIISYKKMKKIEKNEQIQRKNAKLKKSKKIEKKKIVLIFF